MFKTFLKSWLTALHEHYCEDPQYEPPDLLTSLLRTVAEYYCTDPTTAGIVQAYLRAGNGKPARYYASVVRYRESFGRGKDVVAKVEAETAELAVRQLTRVWLRDHAYGPELADLQLAIRAV